MRLREEVYNVLIDILSEFRYCILRNYEELPDFSNDIDILIENKIRKIAIKKLTDNFFSIDIILLQKVEFSCTSLFFYDKITDQFIHIDFFYKIKWRVFEYLDADEILNTRIKYKNFYIPSKNYELQELLLTRLIYHKKIKEDYKPRIIQLHNAVKESNYTDIYNILNAIPNWGEIEKK